MSVYRSAHGKAVDMAALVSRNEHVRAVGNMNVNARGDILDNNNKVIQDNTSRVKTAYNRSVGRNPSIKRPAQAPQAQPQPTFTNTVSENFSAIVEDEIPEELSLHEQELFEDDIGEQELQEIKSTEKK